ncbi:MAG: flippase-like domain-containing protein [Firmicutes bacterium]|nr:flippase-like domain-containing protein [Bacillota bacterium]
MHSQEEQQDILKPNKDSAFKKKDSPWKQLAARLFLPFNLLLAGAVVYYAMAYGEVDLSQVLSVSLNWWWLLLALGIVFLIVVIDTCRLQLVMSATIKRTDPLLCLRVTLLERHYNLLTPFHTGGKAYQMYYYHKHGFRVSEITAVSISNYILTRLGYQIVTGLVIIIFISRIGDLGGEAVVSASIISGIVWTVLTTVGVILLAFGRVIPQKLGQLGVFILSKVRIIKDRENAQRKTDETLWQYRVSMRKLRKRPWTLTAGMIMACFAFFLHYTLILFIYASIWGWDWSIAPILMLGVVLVDYTASLMPIPGGTGAMELFFISIFSILIGTPQVFMAVVLWKIFTYVIPILNGVPVVIFNSIITRKRRKSIDLSIE